MTRQDDELVRRYQEASAQEDARPGAQVRDAVRVHAQMLAAASATASPPAAALPSRAAANQSRWKISALATVALVGLTGLLMLQFERGTPEERDIAFGQQRAQAPVPAAAPAPLPTVAPAVPDAPAARSERSAPATREPEPLTRPGKDAAMSGFPHRRPPRPPRRGRQPHPPLLPLLLRQKVPAQNCMSTQPCRTGP